MLTREPFGKTESRPPELSSFSPDIMMIKIKAMMTNVKVMMIKIKAMITNVTVMMIKIKAMVTNVKVMMRMMLVKMRMRTSSIKHLYNRPSLRLLLSF